MTHTVAFVGPLPPPLHGFSSACASMLERLRSGTAVAVFDRAPRVTGRVAQLLLQLREAVRYLHTLRRSRDSVLYLALSGGSGQIIDALYLVPCRVFRRPMFVHHHSFSYLNRPTLLNRFVFRLLRAATHVVLSDGMGSALTRRYGIGPEKIRVVSNAAFFGPPPQIAPRTPDANTPIRIGFLSNITFDKGLVEFFEVLAQLERLAVAFRATIAGPIAPDAKSTFDRLLAAAPKVDYAGPLYDDAKLRFYQRLDELLFPTRYANEAEPLVIHESLRAGAYVIACARGAIPELLSNGAGLVFEQATFVNRAADAISSLSLDRAALARAQQLSCAQAQRLHVRAESQLANVIREMLN